MTKKKILIPHKKRVFSSVFSTIRTGLLVMVVLLGTTAVSYKPVSFVINNIDVSDIKFLPETLDVLSKQNTEGQINKLLTNVHRRIDPAIEARPYSIEMLDAAGVMFPKIHFIMVFKETSFCRRVSEGAITFCSDDISSVLKFNPNNASGMKHATRRPTTSIGSIGDVVKDLNITLEPKYKRFYDDPHAVYRSPYEHCIDIAIWQRYLMKAYNRYPKTEEEYIDFLKLAGYNPFDKYYNHSSKGLFSLKRMYDKGSFQKRYNKYLLSRMNYTMDE